MPVSFTSTLPIHVAKVFLVPSLPFPSLTSLHTSRYRQNIVCEWARFTSIFPFIFFTNSFYFLIYSPIFSYSLYVSSVFFFLNILSLPFNVNYEYKRNIGFITCFKTFLLCVTFLFHRVAETESRVAAVLKTSDIVRNYRNKAERSYIKPCSTSLSPSHTC